MRTSSIWGGLALSLTLALAACGGGGDDDHDHVSTYLSDPSAQQLVVVNTASHTVTRRIGLGFRPTYLAWVGIVR